MCQQNIYTDYNNYTINIIILLFYYSLHEKKSNHKCIIYIYIHTHNPIPTSLCIFNNVKTKTRTSDCVKQ